MVVSNYILLFVNWQNLYKRLQLVSIYYFIPNVTGHYLLTIKTFIYLFS